MDKEPENNLVSPDQIQNKDLFTIDNIVMAILATVIGAGFLQVGIQFLSRPEIKYITGN